LLVGYGTGAVSAGINHAGGVNSACGAYNGAAIGGSTQYYYSGSATNPSGQSAHVPSGP